MPGLSPATPIEPDYPSPSRAWSMVAILVAATVFSYMDRQLLNLLIDPIRKSLAISDTEISLIQGLAFVLFYTVVGLPLGRLVDRYNRRNLIIIGVVIWSIATILCGFATDFWSLFAARSGVGMGEAILAPAGVSLVADCFPPTKRGRAISALGTAVGLGAGSSYLIGSAVLRIFPGDSTLALPLVGEVFGWQVAFFAAGAPGVLVCLLLLAIREPARRELVTGDYKQASVWPLLKAHLKRHWKAIACVYGCGSILNVMSYGAHAWSAAYLMRRFGLPGAQVGLMLGTLAILASLGGGLGCAWTSDWLAKRRVGGRILGYPLCLAACLPFAILWPLAPGPYIALLLFLLSNWAYQSTLLATPTMIQELAPNEIRGLLLAGYSVAIGVAGAGFGPISVALVTDYVFHDDHRLGASIIAISVPSVVVAGLLGLLGARTYARSRTEVIEMTAPPTV